MEQIVTYHLKKGLKITIAVEFYQRGTPKKLKEKKNTRQNNNSAILCYFDCFVTILQYFDFL